jgi:peroxiredoxin
VRARLLATLSLVLAGALPAAAALSPGTQAPRFATQASLGGKVFTFDLQAALAKGPVVLYFYPAAFTQGCTIEAHEFASHIADYHKLGAEVIGVSGDGIAKLNEFSVSECRSKFAVASDADHHISKEYDALIGVGPVEYSDRTSYVIAPSGKIVYTYTDLSPDNHVKNTLAALERLRAR